MIGAIVVGIDEATPLARLPAICWLGPTAGKASAFKTPRPTPMHLKEAARFCIDTARVHEAEAETPQLEYIASNDDQESTSEKAAKNEKILAKGEKASAYFA
jgi:hypothetical protein